MKATLSNGVTVEGTETQIRQIARTFGISLGNDGVYYNSTSRGLIRIDQMDKTHVRNAVLKLQRQWSESLRTMTDKQVATALTFGNQDVTYKALVTRLAALTRFE